MIVEGDLADDRVLILGLAQFFGNFLAVGADLLDRVHDQVCRGEGERAVGLGRFVVFLQGVFAGEIEAAGEFFPGRAFDERQRTLGELSAQAIDERIRLDSRGALEHCADAELLHLRTDAHAQRRQAAEVNDVGLEVLRPGEFGGEVLLVGGDAEGADDLPTAFLQVLAEVLVVALAVVRGVVDHHPFLVLHAGHELCRDLVLVDHGAVDAMDFGELVGVGDGGKHRAPDDDRQAELVVRVHRGDRGHRAVVRHAGDDRIVRGRLGRHLHRDVGLALVVQADEFVGVFGLGVLVSQAHRQIRRVAPADAVGGNAPGKRTDESDLDRLLRAGRARRERKGHTHQGNDCVALEIHGFSLLEE